MTLWPQILAAQQYRRCEKEGKERQRKKYNVIAGNEDYTTTNASAAAGSPSYIKYCKNKTVRERKEARPPPARKHTLTKKSDT